MTLVYCDGHLKGRLQPDGKVRLSRGETLNLDIVQIMYGKVSLKQVGGQTSQPMREDIGLFLAGLQILWEEWGGWHTVPMLIGLMLILEIEQITDAISKLLINLFT